jgi:dihydropteroate synthase
MYSRASSAVVKELTKRISGPEGKIAGYAAAKEVDIVRGHEVRETKAFLYVASVYPALNYLFPRLRFLIIS